MTMSHELSPGEVRHQAGRVSAACIPAQSSRSLSATATIYLNGAYDIAIGYAFKVVEIRMREKGEFSKAAPSSRASS